MWNPLATRAGRLTTFFLLYVSEGIPLGFAATTVVAALRQENVDAAWISMFVGLIYLPWSWKWVIAPVVDCVSIRRFGHFRPWIIVAQLCMALSLCAGAAIDPVINQTQLIVLILVVNAFGAIQDVAIDGLACNILTEDERGTANGLMFAGAYAGQAVGGSLMLALLAVMPLSALFLIVPAIIVLITVSIALPLREPPRRTELDADGAVVETAWTQIIRYPRRAFRAFASSRNARLAVLFAALPCGGYALSLALQTNLSVEFGLTTGEIAKLSLASTILSGLMCALGGWASDRLGRRLTLGTCVVLLCIPGAILALAMKQAGWIMPVEIDPDNPVRAATSLLIVFVTLSLIFAAINGFMYGIRTALFMDVCSPAVAATQFTAYMAILNLVIAYTATWHGLALKEWGYPTTLALDSMAGILCLLPLILMRTEHRPNTGHPAPGEAVEPSTVR